MISVDKEIDIDALSLRLVSSGYQKADLVTTQGAFSLKGNIIDIFPASQELPVRIELFGDIVETIKTFDPTTQRSVEQIQKTYITPVREISFSEESLNIFKDRIKEYCDQNSIRKDLRLQTIELIDNSLYFPGVEYYLPFFYNKTSTIYDYLSENDEIINVDDYLFNPDPIEQGHDPDEETIPFPTKDLFIEKEQILELMEKKKTKAFYSIEFETDSENDKITFSLKDKAWNQALIKHEINNAKRENKDFLDVIKQHHLLNKENGRSTVYTCHTLPQAQRLLFLLNKFDNQTIIDDHSTLLETIDKCYDNNINFIVVSALADGFILSEPAVCVISENEIFGEKQKNIKTSKTIDAFLSVFQELKKNDYVVHSKHGIGIYRGLQKMTIDGIENDFFQIEYADEDLLFVPIYRLNSVQRYISQGGATVKVDKLGGATWDKKKTRAKKATMDLAHQLVKLQSERNLKQGFSFSPKDEMFLKFEAEFEYEETADQLRSINDVLDDMESTKAMDRLICGDVGFGKTEVAIRAAFKAAKDGKQVAVLVPTTILAFQHYQVFKKRLQNYPINIELLNRFKSPKEQKEIVAKLKRGEVDITIGTHRILSNDVHFSNLGLLIVDEEQRFGVKHKEKIKEFSANVDILTMTATPIPRTLNLSLIGLKDISVITTPPVDRFPIKTFVSKFSNDLIRKAILFELKRGGQVFFLHNRVQDLGELQQKLKQIVPEARIISAHGQMNEKELEEKMMTFYNKEADVLLCTTIIESGLDIPNANTIIVNRADNFGLSQLYQIRGRVGRSTKRAYCYLMLPSHFTIGRAAIERIKTLQTFTELGSGFHVASYDLEFRGAGELLGSSQSGFIEDIGLEEYLRLLEEAVEDIKGEEKHDELDPEISINIPAFIPETYIKDINQRLYFYKKLSNNYSQTELKDVEAELEDRYGPPIPEELKNLFSIVSIKQALKPLRISSIKIGNKKLVYTFDNTTNVLPGKIVELVTKMPNKYKITPEMKLISNINDNDWRSAIREVDEFIKLVGGV
ncbi:MAG: transcription-repair coupling factor [bacterium]